jgi:Ca2+-binding EF-hand superfamily protein
MGYNKFLGRNATANEIEKIFFDADTNDSGKLDYEEFV